MGGRLEGKVCFVTGGASGIGRGCCLRCAEEGADIVVADIQEEAGGETVRLVEATGRRALFLPLDTTREDLVDGAVDQAVRAFGAVHVCVAAAGIARGGPGGYVPENERLVVDKPTAYWHRVIDVNLHGVMYTNRAVARHMIARGGGGKIVNITSGNATLPTKGVADYCVSKAGVWMLTRVLALELAPYGINVNAVAPGLIETPLTQGMADMAGRWERSIGQIPLRRIGQPVDIANTVLFLSSDESEYMTGQMLHVNGGLFTG